MSEKQTAKNALDILCRYDAKFRRLNSQERKNLATAFAREGKVVYGRAFDLVKCNKPIDFANQADIERNFNSIVVYEVKSTSRNDLSDDFSDYFFDLTTAELLVAQSLGGQFMFALVNTITGSHKEMPLRDLLARTSKIYPKWAITLGRESNTPAQKRLNSRQGAGLERGLGSKRSKWPSS